MIIIVAFTLLTIEYITDAFDDFWLLEIYIEDTIYEEIFEHIIGEIVAFSLLGYGLVKWIPALATEIEERTKAEEELSKNNSLLSGLLNSIPDMISFKYKNGKYLGCNPAVSKNLNLPKESIKGKKDNELFSTEKATRLQEQDNKIVESGTLHEFSGWDQDTYHDTLKAPLYNTKGERIGILGISRDTYYF